MGKSITLYALRNLERNLEIEENLLMFYEEGNFNGKYIYYLGGDSFNTWVVSDTNIIKEKNEKVNVLFKGSLYRCFEFLGYDRNEAERILTRIQIKYRLRGLKKNKSS